MATRVEVELVAVDKASASLDKVSTAMTKMSRITFASLTSEMSQLAANTGPMTRLGVSAVQSLTSMAAVSGPVAVGLTAVAAGMAFVFNESKKTTEVIKGLNEKMVESASALKAIGRTQEDANKQTIIHAQVLLLQMRAQLAAIEGTTAFERALYKLINAFLELARVAQPVGMIIAGIFLRNFDMVKRGAEDLAGMVKKAWGDMTSGAAEEQAKLAGNIKALEADIVAAKRAANQMIIDDEKKKADIIRKENMTTAIHTVSLMADVFEKNKTLTIASIALAKSLAIANAIAAAAKHGPIGAVLAAAQVGLLAAQFDKEVNALKGVKGLGAMGSLGAASPAGSPAGNIRGASGAISSNAREVVNNVSVNMPIQAMDLASISDAQMKNLAFRLGRVLREVGATGQFTLSGA